VNELKLYHAIISVCAQKVRIALAEKGLTHDEQVMSLRGDQFAPEYLKLNPNALVPTLVHRGVPVIESTVILHYLEDAFPEPRLMPGDAIARSQVHLFNKFIDEYVHAACSVLTFALAFRPAMARLDPGAREALLAPQPNQQKAERKRDVTLHGMESRYVREALRDHHKLLERMENALDHGPYLTGEDFSIADIAVLPYIVRLEMLRLDALWEKRPGVVAWYQRLRERPAVQAGIFSRFSQCDLAAFANFEPDPWPRAREILAAG